MNPKCAILISAMLLCLITSRSYAQGWQWPRGNTGAALEAGWAVATDTGGNLFMVSINTNNVSSPAVFGSFSIPYTSAGGMQQCIITKSDAAGNVLWARSTGAGQAWPISVVTDRAGNLYLFGSCFTATLQIGTITLTNTSTPNSKYFLVKYDPAGNVLWAKMDGGAQNGYLLYPWGNFYLFRDGAIAIDASDNVYITSSFTPATITIGTTVLTNADASGTTDDIFIAKYDPSGNVIWAKSAGGTRDEHSYGLTVTPAGDIYVAGDYRSPALAFGTTTLTTSTLRKIFIARFDAAMNPTWAVGSGMGQQYISDVKSDALGNVYITGGFEDASLTIGATTMTNSYAGKTIAYLAQICPTNDINWFKTFGYATNNVNGYSLAVTPFGNVWMSADMMGQVTIEGTTLPAEPANGVPPDPAFIVGYDIKGTLINYASLPSGGDDENGIACDTNGNVYFASDYYGPITVAGTTMPNSPPSMEYAFWTRYKYTPVRNVFSSDTIFKSRDTAFCSVPDITLDAPTGYTSYIWNDGSTATSRHITNTGTYWVMGTSVVCKAYVEIDTFHVRKSDLDLSFSLGADTNSCQPVTLQAPSNPLVLYTWQDGSTGTSFSAGVSGNYICTATAGGCSFTDTVQVTIDKMSLQPLRDTNLCQEQGIQLALQPHAPAGASLLWSTGATGPVLVVREAGTYWVTIQNGPCTATDTATISAQYCDCALTVPNAFSPNKDGKNDYFSPIIQAGCKLTDYSFGVFNRWGQEVFSSKDPAGKWNGTFKDVDAELGTYFWMLEYKGGTKGVKHLLKGDVTLVR